MQEKKSRKARKRVMAAIIFAILALIAANFIQAVNEYYPVRYEGFIEKYSAEYGLDSSIVYAVIHAESKFKEDAVSRKGASGLMQIIESTAYWLVPKVGINDFEYSQIFDPEINIQLGCYYLSMLSRLYGDIELALCAYNAGSGNVDSWLQNSNYSSNGESLDHIPFAETRNYVKRVSGNRKIYTAILGLNRFVAVTKQNISRGLWLLGKWRNYYALRW